MEDLASHHEEALSDSTSPKEKRDVRTKFKLSGEALDAKEWLTDYWDMTQKDVAEVVADVTGDFLDQDPELRDAFVESAQSRPEDLSRKTHVVSAATRDFLQSTARELNLTRDQFFDGALRLVRGMVRSKQKQQIKDHEELLPLLQDLRDRAMRVEEKVNMEVHDDDPLGLAVTGVARHLEEIVSDLNREIDQGAPLEPDHTFI